MKILHLTPTYLPTQGGAEYQIKYLDDYYNSNGHISKVVLNKGLSLSFLKEIRSFKPNVVHCHFAIPNGFLLALFNKKIPFIITSHGYDIQKDKDIGYGSRLNPIKAWMVKYALKRASRHTIVSESMRSDAISAGSKSNQIRVVYNAIPKRNILNWNNKGKTQEKYVLSLCRFHKKKGLDTLLKAAALLPNQKFIIVGTGEELENLINLNNKLNNKNVEFVGEKIGGEKDELFHNCTLFCLPPRKEPFGIVFLEAMEHNKPIVCTKVDGIPEVVGGAGAYVEVDDYKELAQTIKKVLDNKTYYEVLSKNAKNQLKQFYITKIAQQYIQIYQEVTR
jgi:glycosyltransferase involved in cell wall biosynthesis